jgi:hypothetical protein
MKKIIAALSMTLVIGCQQKQSAEMCCVMPASETAAVVARPTIRIDAGATAQTTHATGADRLADTGFDDGETRTWPSPTPPTPVSIAPSGTA